MQNFTFLRLYSFLLFSIFTLPVFGQLATPCPSNTQPPADDCGVCIYCGFNGLMSSTANYTPNSIPGFCGAIENCQFIGFIAGETGATFSAIPTSCKNGDGVQVALLDATCSSLLGCYAGQTGGASIPSTISINNMVVGQTYYFVIDGYAGDECSFTIAVSPNSAIVPPFPTAPDDLYGPTEVCPNSTERYCVSPIVGAAAYVWTAPAGTLINGMPPPVTLEGWDGLCANITYPSFATLGPILVNGINSCFNNTPPGILVVSCIPIEPTIESFEICQSDFPYQLPWGALANEPGSFEHTYLGANGCDSLVTHILTPKGSPTVFENHTICSGESLLICGHELSTPGNHIFKCPAIGDCDSTRMVVTLNVVSFYPEIQGDTVLTCANPSLMLYREPDSFHPNIPPNMANWYDSNGILLSTDDTLAVSVPGTYFLELKAANNILPNCVAYDSIVVVDSCITNSYFLEKNAEVRIYPNATTGQLFIESLALDFPINAIQVQALDGRILIEKSNLNTNLQELDLGKYAKGTYLLWAEVGGQRLLFKVLLQ